ncbi:MAG: c-type cytochrome [Brachymonas denitrificans]|jgi:cytochrome c5|uniref:c-type cytochrome n=1 Tax=Brachymonas denitrificans TaxID=28220 RepID=UPI0020219825|nr:c-type cytochrome [Brachymonas denitrificans]
MSQNALDTYNVSEATKNRQLAIVAALTFGALFALLAVSVYFSTYATPSFNAHSPAAQMAAAQRIQKVGSIELQAAPAGGGAPKTGEEAYKAACAACHDAGVTGAPKLADAADWGPRIGQGVETLFKHAIEGFTGAKGTMPPRGGTTFTDDEVKRAVVFMANKSGASFAEPKAADGAAGAASGAASAPAADASAAAPAAAAPAASAAAPAAAATAVAAGAGEALYKSTCQACHVAGVAGAPKLDDKADWAPRIAQGEATLFKHAIEGFTGAKGVMPPKGGSTASDDEIKAAVQYMVSQAK